MASLFISATRRFLKFISSMEGPGRGGNFALSIAVAKSRFSNFNGSVKEENIHFLGFSRKEGLFNFFNLVIKSGTLQVQVNLISDEK